MTQTQHTTPLGELCDQSRGITYGIVKVGDFVPGGVRVIRGGDIRDGRIVFDDHKRVSEDVSNQFARTILRGGEILINLISEPGHTAIVPFELRGANVSRDVGVIPLHDRVDHRYVDYVLKSPRAVEWLTSRLQGSVTAKINLGTLRDLPIPTPSLPQQRAIARILGALDDKIELNRRMNETLEAMARAIFQSWFVDFDPVRAKMEGRQPEGMDAETAKLFPSAFGEDELPADWGLGELRDLITLERGLSYTGAGLAEEGVPMVNLGCFGGSGRFVQDKLKYYRGEYRARHLVDAGELVIANTDITQKRVVLGTAAVVPDLGTPTLFSHHVSAARRLPTTGKEWIPYLFFLLLEPETRERCGGFATGTTVLALPGDAVLGLPYVRPPSELVAEFARVVDSLWRRQAVARRESDHLADTRDTLLPRLLSGELRVPDAERAVADAL